MAQLMQPSFAGGEISPSLHARVDLAKYLVALSTCRNFIVQAWGGAANRTGTEYVGEVKDSTRRSWLVPFQFKTDDTYVLEFANQVMRVIRGGAYVLETGVTITGITQSSQATVTATNSYTDGDEIYLSGIEGMTELNGRTLVVANASGTDFKLQDRWGNYVNSTDFGAWSAGGTAARVYQITTPYLEADLPRLKWVQSADVMTLTHVEYAPRELTRTGHASWTLSEIAFGPEIDAPASATAVIGGGMSSGGETYSYKVTAISDDTGEESLPSPAVSVSGDAASAWVAGEYIDVAVASAVSGASQYRFYKDENGVFGYIGTAEGLTFRDDKIDPDTTDTPPILKEPFEGASNWPGCTTYHQERQFYGRTTNKPQTIFGSQTGNYKNFNVSVPVKDDDALTFGLVARQVNEIRHLVSLKRLLVFTSGSENVMQGAENRAITPTSVQVDPESYRGSSHVHPQIVGNIVLYLQEKGQIIRDLGYEFTEDSYTGNDLTILARHLFEGREIVQMAYAQSPYSIIWCVMSDGALLSLTYLREHQVWAWARHDTDGRYESVAVISEGQEDVPYFTVQRRVDGRTARYVERLHSRQFTDVRDCFFVDSGLTLDEPVTISAISSTNPAVVQTATAHGFETGDLVDIADAVTHSFDDDGVAVPHATSGNRYKVGVTTEQSLTLTDKSTGADIDGSAWAAYFQGGVIRKAVTTVSNLHHLEGKEVAVLADGNVVARQTVSNGAIMLDEAASRVHAGLPYTSDLATLSLDTGNGQLQGRRKSVPYVTARLEKSRGGFYGPSFAEDDLTEWKQRELEDYDEPTALLSGDAQIPMTNDWAETARICIRQVDPLPLSVLGLIPEIQTGGH